MRVVGGSLTNQTQYIIHAGEYFATPENAVITTTLGSCVSVCLYDPVAQIGGMNHFVLPEPADKGVVASPGRFGVFSMNLLMKALIMKGASPKRLVAKVFGGGHPTNLNSGAQIAQKNISFAMKFLSEAGIPVLSKDVGGDYGRHVSFDIHTGRTFIKYLKRLAGGRSAEPMPSSISI